MCLGSQLNRSQKPREIPSALACRTSSLKFVFVLLLLLIPILILLVLILLVLGQFYGTNLMTRICSCPPGRNAKTKFDETPP